MIASQHAAVSSTHNPCSVHVMKNRSGSVLIVSKRPSVQRELTPAEQKRAESCAHTPTIAATMRARASSLSLRTRRPRQRDVGEAAREVVIVLGLRPFDGTNATQLMT